MYNKGLIRAFIAMGGATVFFKGLSLLKEIYIANAFGVDSNLEAYFIAFVYIGFPISVVIVPFQTSFIASLARHDSKGNVNDYVNKIYSSIFFVSACIILLWFLVLEGVKDYVFVDQEAVMNKVYILLPFVFVNSINLILYGVMQFKGFFTFNGYLPSISPICVLLGLIFFESLFGVIDVDVIIVAIGLASLIEFLILRNILEVKFVACKDMGTLRSIFNKSYFLILSSIVMATAPMIEQYYSSSIQESGVVLLRYASIIPLAISGVFSTVVAVVILPYFAKLYFDGVGLIKKYWNFLGLYVFLIVGFYFALSIFSGQLLSVIYSDVILLDVSILNFNLYLISGALLCLSGLGVRLLSSMHKGRVIFVVSILSLFVEVLVLVLFNSLSNLSIVPISIICYFLMSFIGINSYIYFKLKV